MIEESERSLFIYDSISKGCFLACVDFDLGMDILDKHLTKTNDLLMVTDDAIGDVAVKKYGYTEVRRCYQYVFCGESISEAEGITIRKAGVEDLPVIFANYDLISTDEIKQTVKMGNILMGYAGDKPVGFIGEHLEGSMGLLNVLPEHRRKGYATALEKEFIRRTIEQGFIPFCHVEKENTASIALQEKLGLKRSDTGIYWMWRT